VSFEGRENRGLKGVLLEEKQLSGILRWAVEGCREYLDHGLEYPEKVLEATAAYKSESDKVEQFLAECFVRGDGFSARARPLYPEFCKWAEGTGAMSETAFGRRMVEKGFAKQHTDRGNIYLGLAPLSLKNRLPPEANS
jgi:putative DNA primase/helicase